MRRGVVLGRFVAMAAAVWCGLSADRSEAALVTDFAAASFPTPAGSGLYVTDASGGFADNLTSSQAQTFQVANTFKLDKLSIRYNQARVGESLTLAIYQVADVNNLGTLTLGATVLAPLEFTIPANATTGSAATILSFDLTDSDEVMLPATTGTAGYAVQIVNSDFATDTAADFFWYRTTTNAYSGGIAYDGTTPANSNAAIGNTRDFSLALVPEPSSLAMVAAAAGLLLGRRRRTA